MTGRLEGKVSIITGGGGAMPGAQAVLFASEGSSVCVTDVNLENANAVVERIKASGGKALSHQLDVRDQDECDTLGQVAEKEFGPVDILCNNAGANFRVSFEEQSLEMWNQIIEIGLTGTFLGIKAVVPSMRKAGGGVILNMGSLASIRPGGGSPGYAAWKMGMIGLNRSAAGSFAKDNIRSVLISPGHVDTPFIRGNNPHSPNDWKTSIDNPENYKSRLEKIPAGRFITPEDIAKVSLFLASEESSMITGAIIPVDGGTNL